MKQWIIFLWICLAIPCFTQAQQLSQLIKQYQGKPGVSITHLDESLYGLYKKKNLSPEAEQLLRNLKEVNILSFNSVSFQWNTSNIIDKLKNELKDYILVKNNTTDESEQYIYTKTASGKVTDMLIINNEQGEKLDIIELSGNIEPENIALLSKALNIKGLNSLSLLNPENKDYNRFLRSFDYNDLATMSKEIREMAQEMQKKFQDQHSFEFDMPNMDSLFNSMGMGFDAMGNMFEQLSNNFNLNLEDGNIIGNSIQITEENGKTKIKVNSKNSEIAYIIDGVEATGQSINMPEKIRSIKIQNDPENPQKAYLIVMSDEPLGQFVSLKNGSLTFKYNDQEYKYNLEKSTDPLLWVNGRLTSNLDNYNVSDILQIRPVSEDEKQTGAFKTAEVVINTKDRTF